MQYSNHGANPNITYQKYNLPKPKKIIDFSTNTNVISKKIYIPVGKLSRTYPDYTQSDIKQILSKKCDISVKSIMVTNGINEFLYLLSHVYHNQKIGLLKEDYTEYKRAFQRNQITFFDSIEQVKNVDVFICSNPNNPQGHKIEDSILEKLSLEMLVVIDESYLEFLEDKYPTVNQNIIRLRSLTKIYHLSGLRIGYVVGEEKLIKVYSTYQPTWSVNSVALYAAKKYLNDQNFMEKTRAFYQEETEWLKHKIRELGIDILPSIANFMLLRISSEAIPFFLKRGIVVRHTYSYPNLNGKYIRVSVQKRKHNKLLIKALKEYQNENLSN